MAVQIFFCQSKQNLEDRGEKKKRRFLLYRNSSDYIKDHLERQKEGDFRWQCHYSVIITSQVLLYGSDWMSFHLDEKQPVRILVAMIAEPPPVTVIGSQIERQRPRSMAVFKTQAVPYMKEPIVLLTTRTLHHLAKPRSEMQCVPLGNQFPPVFLFPRTKCLLFISMTSLA